MPALFAPTPAAAKRKLEFFTANIRIPNTRQAYVRAVTDFGTWSSAHELQDLASTGLVHVAMYIEQLHGHLSAPSVKQHLAALRVRLD